MIKALLIFCLTAQVWSATALSLELGSLVPSEDMSQHNLNFSGHLWYQFDQMVFVGVGSGVQDLKGDNHYPALASLFIRLPIGGQALPFIMADWGYLFGPSNQTIWKVGSGIDLKLGDSSSLLFSGGWQEFSKTWNDDLKSKGHIYLQAGLLLEF